MGDIHEIVYFPIIPAAFHSKTSLGAGSKLGSTQRYIHVPADYSHPTPPVTLKSAALDMWDKSSLLPLGPHFFSASAHFSGKAI